MLIISQIFAGQHLCQKNDLARVLRKVLHNMRDSFEHCHIVALRQDAFSEPRGWDFPDDCGSFDDGGFQKLGQIRGCHAATRVKLRVTLAMVRQFSYARTNPLPNVSGKMQNQVTDGVFVFGMARPDLLRSETRQAILNAAVKLFQLLGREPNEDFFGGHAIKLLRTNSRGWISPCW
jgi:hypothetical protein